MPSIFTGQGFSSNIYADAELILSYINYDRDAEVDPSDLFILISKTNGPNADGSITIKNNVKVQSYSLVIYAKDGSNWIDTEFTWLFNKATYKGYILKQRYPQQGVTNYSFTASDGTKYKGCRILTYLLSYASFDPLADLKTFGINQINKKIPFYDYTKEPLVDLSEPEAGKYVIDNKMEAENQYIIDGDMGITRWDIYCFDRDFPQYKVVWKNDIVESEYEYIKKCTIKVQVGDVPQEGTLPGQPSIIWRELGTYPYSEAYMYFTYYQITEDNASYEYYGNYPFIKLELLNPEGINVLSRYAQFQVNSLSYYFNDSTNQGDILVFHKDNYGDDDNGYKDRIDNLEEIDPLISFGNSSELIVTSYVLSDAQLKALTYDVWDTSGLENVLKINSAPLDSLLSVYRTPFALSGGEVKHIVIGSYKSGVTAQILTDSQVREIGNIQLSYYYNSFLDFEPYTKILLFLPLYGLTTIEPSMIKEPCKLWYSFDMRMGTCSITLRRNNNIISSWQCNVGDSLELSSSNVSQVRNSISLGALSSVLSVGGMKKVKATTVAGAGADLLSTINDSFATVRTGGSFNVSAEMRNGLTAYLIYVRPVYTEPSNYRHTNGKPTNLTRTIGTLNGYTKVGRNVDLSGIPCTESQRQMIFEKLTGGFYI